MKLAGNLLMVLGVALLAAGAADLLVAGVDPANVLCAGAGLACLIAHRVTGTNTRARVVLVVASVAVAFSVAELALRLVPVDRIYGEYIPESSAAFHHNYRPGDFFIRRPTPPDDFAPVENRINSLGMRGPERDVRSAQVMLIGDSFIQATQVDYEKTLGRLLERRLRETDRDAVVVSHGMGSWSPLLEWNWYLRLGRRFRPRVLFLFVFYNDFDPQYDGMSDSAYMRQTVFGPDGRPLRFEVGRPPSPLHRALAALRFGAVWRLARERISVLATNMRDPTPASERRHLDTAGVDAVLEAPEAAFERDLAALRVSPSGAEGFWQLQRPLPLWPTHLRRSAELSEPLLVRFAEDVGRDGGRLVLVYVPTGFQIGPRECEAARDFYGLAPGAVILPRSGVQDWLEAFARTHAIAWLDPTEALRAVATSARRPLYLSYDCHWSDVGHARMAEILIEWLASSGTRL